MKRFFLKLLIFFLIVLAIDISYGLAMKHIRRNVAAGMTRLDNQAVYETTAPVLIFGSSRARRHYDTRIFADSLGMEVFNCGYNSMGIVFFDVRLTQILKRYTPRVIIYDITPLFDMMKSAKTKTDVNRLKPFFFDPEVYDAVLRLDTLEWFKSHSATYRYHDKYSEYISDNANKEEFHNGYAPLRGSLSVKEQKHAPMKIDPAKMAILDNFATRCHDRNIELYFVLSPYYKNDMGDQAAELRRLAARHRLHVLDHFNDSTFTADSTLYWDASHMNADGATLFSRIVASKIAELRRER